MSDLIYLLSMVLGAPVAMGAVWLRSMRKRHHKPGTLLIGGGAFYAYGAVVARGGDAVVMVLPGHPRTRLGQAAEMVLDRCPCWDKPIPPGLRVLLDGPGKDWRPLTTAEQMTLMRDLDARDGR
jgi:hypothetical protein